MVQAATSDLLIVDPYLDEKALTDYALLAREDVRVRLLADEKAHKASLKPAAARWSIQFKGLRPLEVRLAPAKSLHDRLIIVDEATVWVLTQSLNRIATRSPASIVLAGPEVATLKVEAYSQMWMQAVPLA